MNDTMLSQIEKVIDEQIRPSLLANAGDISITSLKDGILHLRLEGRCAGCPSAWLTAEEGIKRPLMQKFPKLSDVLVQTIPTK